MFESNVILRFFSSNFDLKNDKIRKVYTLDGVVTKNPQNSILINFNMQTNIGKLNIDIKTKHITR